MATKLVTGGKITSDGTFLAYDKASKQYVNTGSKVNANDFGRTKIGQGTEIKGNSNPLVSSFVQGANKSVTDRFKTSGGITSSNSVLTNKNMTEARGNAANALLNQGNNSQQGAVFSQPSQQGFTLNPLQQNAINQNTQAQNQFNSIAQQQLNAVGLRYDAALRRQNQQYDSLLRDLETQSQNDLALATANAAALNPYSQAQGAVTARNFNSKIQQNYQAQAADLQLQAEAAEEALRAGENEAYLSILANMQKSNSDFQKNMNDYLLSAQSEFNAAQQFERSFGLQQQKFDLEAAQAYEGNFNDFINTFGADPAFKAEIENYFNTGKITESLMPLIERGQLAGMSPAEALSVAQYETIQQKQLRQQQEQADAQLALGWYNAQTSRISADTARTKAIKDALDAQNGISDARLQRAETILDFGSRAFDILKKGDTTATGLSGTASLYLPGETTQADKLQGYYDTILGNISLAEMQRLKDESATGSTGLGSVAVAEFNTLRGALGNLSVQNDVSTQQENLASILAAQQNLLLIHAAATGGTNQSPKLLTKADILAEFNSGNIPTSGTTSGGVTWTVVNE